MQIPSLRFNSLSSSKTRPPVLDRSSLVQENPGSVLKVYKVFPEVLGKGAFSEVRRAVHQTTGEPRAIKILKFDSGDSESRRQVFDELEIMKSLDHPFIVKVYEYFVAQSAFYIVMQLSEGRPLFEHLAENEANLTERLIADVLQQILTALNYIHGQGVLHGDIKSQNVLFDGRRITLIDFGLGGLACKKSSGRQLGLGSALYLSPEAVDGSRTEKSDIWSCGVILYMLLTGEAPFQGATDELMMANIKAGRFVRPPRNIVRASDEVLDLLGSMLEPNPKLRPNAAECLRHSFLQGVGQRVDPDELRSVSQHLKEYVFHSNLQTAVFTYFVGLVMSKREQDRLAEVFTALDENRDGVLSRAELKNGLTRAGWVGSEEEVDEVFDRLDLDASGNISFTEYLLAAFDKQQAFDEACIKKLFGLFTLVP